MVFVELVREKTYWMFHTITGILQQNRPGSNRAGIKFEIKSSKYCGMPL